MNRLKCQSCGYESLAFDNFMDLSLSFPRSGVRMTGVVDLKSCLDTFVKPEKMEECGFKCKKCKGVDTFTKDMTIFRFPRILVIHLKRFYNSTMRREKLNTSVKIDKVIDISQYAPFSRKFLNLFHSLDHESKSKAKYRLYGISHHSGTLYGGHYVW